MDNELGAAGLRLEREGPIAWCVIDRPSARNALTPAMYYGIKRAVRLVNTDPQLAALIITGTGDVFAPGGDLGGRAEPGDSSPDDLGYDILPFTAVRESRAPVIAAVNGICQAGGLLIAMMADIAVASDRATFRVPELLRGIPDATYAAALPAHVGLAVARDLLLSARVFDAAEAQRLGVISASCPTKSCGRPHWKRRARSFARRPWLGPRSSACSTSATAWSTTRRCSGRSRPHRNHARAWRRSWRSASPAGSHPTSRLEVIGGQ